MMLAPGPVQPPCHSLGVSLCQIPAGLPIPAGAVVMWLCPCGAQPGARPSHSGDPQGPFGPLPPTLFCGTSGVGQGGPGEAALPQALSWLGL